MPTMVDNDAAQELELYAENTSSLYPQKLAIIENIKKRLKNKTYDPKKAPRLWQHWVDTAAKSYNKEFGNPSDRVDSTFNAATRRFVAEQIARDELQRIKNGEYDNKGGIFGLGILG